MYRTETHQRNLLASLSDSSRTQGLQVMHRKKESQKDPYQVMEAIYGPEAVFTQQCLSYHTLTSRYWLLAGLCVYSFAYWSILDLMIESSPEETTMSHIDSPSGLQTLVLGNRDDMKRCPVTA
ncbi:hypothetical protein IFM89_018944 [Coptis chinensis]|uniref:Uncharacterized protein n=1 Tax=Coptis chinensis TaxID=261450 RepID=A0A835IAJ2_9MAGN|nr:hypothetical protein IFM89_018944 [Coptis chinensis]